MRSLLVVSLLALSLVSESLPAQSLEESYEQLCSKPSQAKTEACQVLAKSLVAKLQGQQNPPASAQVSVIPEVRETATQVVASPGAEPGAGSTSSPVDDHPEQAPDPAVWGVLARLADTRWANADPTIFLQNGSLQGFSFSWNPEKPEMVFVQGGKVLSWIYRFRPSGTLGTLVADIENYQASTLLAQRKGVEFFFTDNVLLVSAPYRFHGYNTRQAIRLSHKGAFITETATEKRGTPQFSALLTMDIPVHKAYSEQEFFQLMQQSDSTLVAAIRQAEAEGAAARKRSREQFWNQAMGALNGALDAGLEVARAQEARSAYELDRTLSDINASVAAQQRAERLARSQAGAERTHQQETQQQARHQPAQQGAAMRDRNDQVQARPAQSAGGTGSWETAGGRSSLSTSSEASTRDDASTCVSAPVTSRHRCDTLVGYKGMVSNSCSVPVEVKMCFMTASGWNCQRNTLRPKQTWEPGWCHANTGQVFHSVRYPDSKTPLASP